MPGVRTRPEVVTVGALLSAVGGYLDACTYVGRGGVFANAQTGNVVLLAVDLAGRHLQEALSHLLPVLAFAVGIAAVETLGLDRVRSRVHRPTRVVLVAEIALLVAVGFVPVGTRADRVVTTAIAFIASLQLGAFRSLRGVTYSSTITTGNLRNLVVALHARAVDGAGSAGARAVGPLAAVVVAFAVGAALGAVTTTALGPRSTWVAAGALLAVLAAIVGETRSLERSTHPAPEPDA